MARKEKKEEKFCFIISHIGDTNTPERTDANRKLKHLFNPVLKNLGYESKRSDEESTPGFISTQIIKRLIDSKLIIADISFENANVFYELAVRHAIKKPAIIIKKPKQKPPFDITDIRAIDVDMSDPDIWQPAMKQLTDYIKESERNPQKASESILSNFTRSFNLQSADDKESDTLRTVKDIKAQLNRMSNDLENVKNKTNNTISTEYEPLTITGTEHIYQVKCKKCKKYFIPNSPPPINLIGLEPIKNIETCFYCGKQSEYENEDYDRYSLA